MTRGGIESSPTVTDGTVFFGSNDGNVYALNSDDGSEMWSFKTDDRVTSSATVVDDTVFIGSVDTNVYALNANDGTKVWSFKAGRYGYVTSSPTVAEGTVFIGSDDGNVYALDVADGSEVWSFGTGASVTSSPTVAGGTVFIGSDDGNVYALDVADGSEVWSFGTGASVTSSPTVAGGTVFIGSIDNMYALDATDGTEVWSTKTERGGWTSSTVVDGTVFVGRGDGNMYALHAGVEGSSEGSRVNLGTLGHHHTWAGNELEPSKPEPDPGDQTVEISFENVRLVQATENTRLVGSDIEADVPKIPDLIVGKETAVLFELEGEIETIETDTLTFEATQVRESGEPVSISFELTKSEVELLMRGGQEIEVFHNKDCVFATEETILRPDVTEIQLTARPDDPVASARLVADDDFATRETGAINIGFIELKDAENGTRYGNNDGRIVPGSRDETPRDRFERLVTEYIEFIESNFPVAGINDFVHPDVMRATADSNDYRKDLKEARDALEMYTPIELDVTLAVVPDSLPGQDDYFSFHSKDNVIGIHPSSWPTQPQASAAMLPVGAETAAHEIGHHFLGNDGSCSESFDSGVFEDELAMRRVADDFDDCTISTDEVDNAHVRTRDRGDDDPGLVSNGYDLSDGSLSVVNFPSPVESIMSYAHTVGETPNAEWIDTFTYQKLIDNEFEPIPPESIDDVVEPILSGRAITTESGETEVTALIQREGRPAPSAGDDGNVSITTRDGRGANIETTTYRDEAVDTFQGAGTPSGSTVTGEFIFTIPFPENTREVEIKQGNDNISFNPIIRSVQDRIERVPDNAFVDEPERRRQDLLDMLSELDEQMDQEDYEAALQTVADFEGSIGSSIKDEYETGAIQPTKDELRDLLVDTELRINTIEAEATGGGLFFGFSIEEIAAGGAVTAGLAYLASRMIRDESK